MSDPIFERYKEALKQGHVAVLRGRHKEALASYARALGRAPRDEGALHGRAEALLTVGRQSEAAEVLERLADVLASTGREPEALATLRRALDLAETKLRRRRYVQLARALRIEEGDAEAAPVAAEPAEAEALVAEAPEAQAVAAEPAEPGATVAAGVAEGEPAAAEPAEAEPVAAESPDPEQLLREAEQARYEGRVDAAVTGYVAAAEGYLAADAPDAALDACQRGLQAAPDSPSVHLTLARVYLARGWRERAVEKLVLLDRLLELDGAMEPRRELAALARQHVGAEPRLEPLVAAGTAGSDGPGTAAPPHPG